MLRRLALVTVAAATVATMGFGSPGFAANTVTAKISKPCPAGQIMTRATFTLTDVNVGQEITVQTPGTANDLSAGSYGNGTATYGLTLDGVLLSATADVPGDWTGSFTLSDSACAAVKAPQLSGQASLPGLSPEVIVNVTNPNTIMLSYQVTVSGLKTQTIPVLAGGTEQAHFASATCGKSYGITVVDSDFHSKATSTVIMEACPAAPVVAAPAKPSAKPAPSHPATPQATQTQAAGSDSSAVNTSDSPGPDNASPGDVASLAPTATYQAEAISFTGFAAWAKANVGVVACILIPFLLVGGSVYLWARRHRNP